MKLTISLPRQSFNVQIDSGNLASSLPLQSVDETGKYILSFDYDDLDPLFPKDEAFDTLGIRIGDFEQDISPDTDIDNKTIKIKSAQTRVDRGHLIQQKLGTRCFFESCFGITEITLFKIGDLECPKNDLHNTSLATFYVSVTPSKIGETKYSRMSGDLQKLIPELICDYIGRSQTVVSVEPRYAENDLNSAYATIHKISIIWKRLRLLIQRMLLSPVKTRRKNRKFVNIQNKKLPEREKQRLCVRRGSLSGIASVSQMEYSFDTPEHRVIKLFLIIFLQEILQCRRVIQNNISIIAVDLHDQFPNSSGQIPVSQLKKKALVNLTQWRKDNLPSDATKKIQKLSEDDIDAQQIYNQIRNLLSNEFWNNVSILRNYQFSSETFYANNLYYSIYVILSKFFLQASFTFDRNPDIVQPTKTTSKMFENWTLLHLLLAFKEHGYNVNIKKFFTKIKNNQYLLDFSDSVFEFDIDSRKKMIISYEPCIHHYTKIKSSQELAFGGDPNVPMKTPDIVLEVRDKVSEKDLFICVIDCKYNDENSRGDQRMGEKYSGINMYSKSEHWLNARKHIWIVHSGLTSSIAKIEPQWEWVFDNQAPYSSEISKTTDIVSFSGKVLIGSIVAPPDDSGEQQLKYFALKIIEIAKSLP